MTEFNATLDASGLNCPLPILKARKHLNSLDSGQVLYIVATDSGSVKDFDSFCSQTGHTLLESSESGGKYHYYIRKS